MGAATEVKTLSYRWPTWIGLLLVIAYLLYLYKQYDDLHRLNQHELALEVREFELIVKNAVDTVNKAVDLCRFDVDQPYIDLDSPSGCKFQPADKVDKAAKLNVDGGLAITTLVNGKTTAAFRVQLDRILAELAFPESFRLVFLAKEDGRILYQEAPGSRRWRRKLSWHEQNFRESTPGETEGVRLVDLQKLLGKDPQPSFSQLTAAGSRINLALGGQSEEVYLQPFTIAGNNLILGGVVSRAELLRRALQVETYSVTLLIFLFFVGLFGYPFIKLYALDSHERFRLPDACLLYLSSGALLALGVFSVLALDGYRRFGAEADRGLEELSSSLSDRFAGEVSQAVRQLVLLDQTATASQLLPACGTARKPHFRWLDESAPSPPVPAPAFLVNAEQVAWVSAGGTQIFKVTADSAGENVSVKSRNYFQAVRQASFYQQPGGPEFFVGPSRSITDGKFYTFFSIRTQTQRAGQCKADDEPLAAVLTTHLLSLDRQPLPAGYGFALLNREGAALFHSDSRLSLRENLFAELGDSAGLKSLVLAGRQGHLDTSYREKPYRFFVSPFERFQPSGPAQAGHLFMVTFRDVSTEVATVSYVFLESILLLLILILVWTVAVVVVDQVSRFRTTGVRRGGTWLWPQRSLDRFYRFQAIALAALTILTLGFVGAGQREWAQLMLLGGPLFAVVIGIANHFLTHQPGQVRERSQERWCRNIQWALLAFWIAFAPAAMIFRLSLAHEFGKLVETDRHWIAQQRLDVEKAVRKEGQEEEYPRTMIDRVACLRGDHYQAPPPKPFDATPSHIGTSAKAAAIEWAERLGELLPIHTETGVRLRAQEFRVSYAPPGRLSWWAALLLVLLFAAAISWIHWNSTNLFLTDFETPRFAPAADDAAHWEEQWERLPADRQNLLLQLARDHLPNPKNIDAVKELLNGGFLRLDPDLEPSTPGLAAFLSDRARSVTQLERLKAWESGNVQHSWNSVRRLLITGLACIAFFVVATQPGLQSGLTAGFGLATTVLVAFARMRDALADLFAGRQQAAAAGGSHPPSSPK